MLTFVYAGVLVGRTPYTLVTGLFVFVFVVVFEWRRDMSRREMGRMGLAAAILAIVFAVAVSYTFERLFLVTLP